jgi:hypothetical protein
MHELILAVTLFAGLAVLLFVLVIARDRKRQRPRHASAGSGEQGVSFDLSSGADRKTSRCSDPDSGGSDGGDGGGGD